MHDRLMLRFPILAAVLALAGSSAEAAKGPRVALGKWAVDYAQEYCVLSRDGLAGETGVAFRTRPFSDEHDLLLYVPRNGEKERSIKGRLSIGGDAPGAERWISIGEPRRAYKLIDTRISTDELTRIAVSTSIRLSSDDRLDMTVQLPLVAKAMAALRLCEVDLAGRWGVDSEEMKGWAKPARSQTDLRSMFWSEDHSSVAMLRSAVRAVLDIDAQGIMVGCKIVQSSRVAWVDRNFCDILGKEARFHPAVDANGKPVRGRMVTPPITSARLR